MNRLVFMIKTQPIWIFVLACFVFFSFASPYFFDIDNFANILVQASTVGLIALGMTYVMINGNIDLSVGATLALAASLAVGLQEHVGIAGAVGIGLFSGILIGGVNGIIAWKTGVDAFIVTLGAMIGVRGLVFVYTEEQSFYAYDLAYSDFGSSSLFGMPVLALIFILFTILMHFVLKYSVHGRNVFAVGGNRQAAKDAGIRVGPHMLINFILVGFLAALSGILLSTQMGASTPNLGRNYELWTITAVVLGGTRLTGGFGSIVGTFGGVLAIAILRNGMNLLQVPSFYVLIVLGTILIAVLFLDKQFGEPQGQGVKA